ncbi:HEPN domain-containing protein [Vibrio harveyi]|uniref:HEPN domain-containing protein n=1 Tax=Vibrio harveyi TaxID=669 RepID=UPI00165DB8F7|nr:HEPN domain-containing protein [Vibrio harveyi]
MKLSQKRVREIVGYTFEEEQNSVESWFFRAESFKEAAILLNQSDLSKVKFAYFYNAAISLELLFKAALLQRSGKVPNIHKLPVLAEELELPISNEQSDTLELLSEIIIWSGRYPVPSKGSFWDTYHDVIQKKHIIREGNITKPCPDRFPSLDNVSKIWKICIEAMAQKSA